MAYSKRVCQIGVSGETVQWVRLLEYLKSHPAIEAVYGFWQKLGRLLRIKHRTARQCRRLIPIFLSALEELRSTAGRERLLGESSAVALFRGSSRRSTRTARHCRGCHSDGRGIAVRGSLSAGKKLFQESAHTSKQDFSLLSPIQRSQRPPAVDTRGSFVSRSTSANMLPLS